MSAKASVKAVVAHPPSRARPCLHKLPHRTLPLMQWPSQAEQLHVDSLVCVSLGQLGVALQGGCAGAAGPTLHQERVCRRVPPRGIMTLHNCLAVQVALSVVSATCLHCPGKNASPAYPQPHLWRPAAAWPACVGSQPRRLPPRWAGRAAGCWPLAQQHPRAAPGLGRGAVAVAGPAVRKVCSVRELTAVARHR